MTVHTPLQQIPNAPPRSRKHPVETGLFASCLFVALALCTTACGPRPQPDNGLYGAYKNESGEILIIVPSAEKNTMRLYDTANGLSRRLYPVASASQGAGVFRYQAGEGWAVKEPAAMFVKFEKTAGAEPTLLWEEPGKAPIKGLRMRIGYKALEFESQGLTLAGRLYLPEGPGPHPAIVVHQGSERDSGKDHNSSGYLFAAHGVAAFCYDKRGVGSSQGEFTMDFHKLAVDMGAAVERLKQHRAIDPGRIGVGGYSQGGWIGPLAASERSDIRFVHVGFGLADTPFDEDREQTLNGLRDLGYKDADLDKARRVIGAVQEVIRQDLNGGWKELGALKEEYRNEPWMKHLDEGMAGTFIKWPGWVLRHFAKKRVMLYGLTWDYDPRPTLEKIQVPMLWLLGAEDRQAPNQETLARLDAFKRAGKPFEVIVLPGTDHGGVVFRVENGQRIVTGIHPDCMRTEAQWVARVAGTGA